MATGGGRPDEPGHGWYVQPTVFTGVDNSMTIAREEIFGTVVSVIPYAGEEEAIRIANDSDYGLHGAVFTSDDESALRVASAVRTGTFSVNSFTVNVEAPFGGVKSSGVGRDSGRKTIESFVELKTQHRRPHFVMRRRAPRAAPARQSRPAAADDVPGASARSCRE